MMIVSINDQITRQVWKNARDKFTKTWIRSTAERNQYWNDFGIEHNMRVIIKEWIGGKFALIDEVEFKDEKSYAWFMLRFAS